MPESLQARAEERLNDRNSETRREAVTALGEQIRSGRITREATTQVNNHVHTFFSFSPFSPSGAAYRAWQEGLLAVGIMDHDTVAGCREMLDASASIGIASTVGFELRVNLTGTKLEGRKVNNPDSVNVAYIAIHGIPRRSIDDAMRFLRPVLDARNLRNRRMTANLNRVLADFDMPPIDFDAEIFAGSMAVDGGSITERHILFALAERIVERQGKGLAVLRFLEEKMKIPIKGGVRKMLSDPENPFYMFDFLGALKSTMLERIYEQPDDTECVGVARAVSFAKAIDAIPAYAYLGDVTESPTGDKKAEKFEDDFLDELIEEVVDLGFPAVTYMPPRNTPAQLLRLKRLCAERKLLEISGVDINSPRQSFRCPELLQPEFSHLADAAWALIAHEKLANEEETLGFFSPENRFRSEPLSKRIGIYAAIGRAMDPSDPSTALEAARKEFDRYG